MRNIQGLEEEKFYVAEESDYKKIYDILSHMPNFVLSNEVETDYVDYFFDTPDNFLKQNRATVRVRKLDDKQILSIKYISSNALQQEKVREAYFDMPVDANLANYREAHLFLSNKINDIYAKYLDIDIVRKMRDLKVYLVIYTNRTTYELKNNRETKISVCFDRLNYQSKFLEGDDNVVKFILDNYPDKLNLEIFHHFIKEINKRVYIINDNESKFEAGNRIFNYDRFNKKQVEEEYDEEDENEDEDDKE